jgi:hypothetical protein
VRGVGGNAGRALALAGCLAALPLAACGGPGTQDSDEPSGDFTVEITKAQFPSQQRLAESARMSITVRNSGDKRVPVVAVTLRPSTGGADTSGSGDQGSGAAAFGYRSSQSGLADPTRPIWIVDRGPDQVQNQGPGGAVTAYTDTWAMGSLKPGQAKTFTWDVVPVRPGSFTIGWRVTAGLDGKATAKLRDGSVPSGSFKVSVNGAPSRLTVDDNGNVVPLGD